MEKKEDKRYSTFNIFGTLEARLKTSQGQAADLNSMDTKELRKKLLSRTEGLNYFSDGGPPFISKDPGHIKSPKNTQKDTQTTKISANVLASISTKVNSIRSSKSLEISGTGMTDPEDSTMRLSKKLGLEIRKKSTSESDNPRNISNLFKDFDDTDSEDGVEVNDCPIVQSELHRRTSLKNVIVGNILRNKNSELIDEEKSGNSYDSDVAQKDDKANDSESETEIRVLYRQAMEKKGFVRVKQRKFVSYPGPQIANNIIADIESSPDMTKNEHTKLLRPFSKKNSVAPFIPKDPKPQRQSPLFNESIVHSIVPNSDQSSPSISPTGSEESSTNSALLQKLLQLNESLEMDPRSQVKLIKDFENHRRKLEAQYPLDNHDIDWNYWENLIKDYENVVKNQAQEFSTKIQNGIPNELRGSIWQLVSKSRNVILESKYKDYLKESSPYENLISRDLSRTFPNYDLFKSRNGEGQEALYRVVKAYSIYDSIVGYCQGLPFIVGILLFHMSDEEAFCLLVRLMENYDFRSMYLPGLEGLQMRLYQFDCLLEVHVPKLAKHLRKEGVMSNMYASQWFMTFFSYRFPINLVCRLMDVFLTEGVESIFKFAINFMKQLESKLLKCDFEEILMTLKEQSHILTNEDITKFIENSLRLKITRNQLHNYAKKYVKQVTKNQRDSTILTSENAKLKNQIEDLKVCLEMMQSENKMFQDNARVVERRNAELQEKNKILQSQMEGLLSMNEGKDNEKQELIKMLEDLKVKNENDVTTLNNSILSIVTEAEKAMEAKKEALLEEFQLTKSEMIESYEKKIRMITEDCDIALENQKEEMEAAMQSLKKDNLSMKEEIEKLHAEIETIPQKYEDEITALQEEQQEIEDILEAKTEANQKLNAENEDLQMTVHELSQQNIKMKQEAQEIEEKIEILQAFYDQYKDHFKSCNKEELEKLLKECGVLKENYERLQSDYELRSKEIHRLQAEKQHLIQENTMAIDQLKTKENEIAFREEEKDKEIIRLQSELESLLKGSADNGRLKELEQENRQLNEHIDGFIQQNQAILDELQNVSDALSRKQARIRHYEKEIRQSLVNTNEFMSRIEELENEKEQLEREISRLFK